LISPKVFISYSHDSGEHEERILSLADRLRAEGVDCQIDLYEIIPREGWVRWMDAQIEAADYVLVVCTEKYNRRFRGVKEGGRGLGANWEGAIITQMLYEDGLQNDKFIPVVFSQEDEKHVPRPLRPTTRYNLSDENEYELLYRYLTFQPKAPKPPLGSLRSLPPRERRLRFVAPRGEAASGLASATTQGAKNKSEKGQSLTKNLLSNRVNRHKQVFDFRTAMEVFSKTRPPRPLVCVIHGDEYEGHSEFLIRLMEELLPEKFEELAPGRAGESAIEKQAMKLPLGELTIRNYKKILWDHMRMAFNSHALLPEESVRTLVVDKKLAVIIHVDLDTAHWDGVDLAKLDIFFKFWEDRHWRNLPEKFLLLVCLCCTYKRRPKGAAWKSEDPNKDMRDYIERLKRKRYRNICVAPIEELSAVEHRDAKALVEDERVKQRYNFEYHDIAELYRNRELCDPSSGGIPMDRLLIELRMLDSRRETARDRE